MLIENRLIAYTLLALLVALVVSFLKIGRAHV